MKFYWQKLLQVCALSVPSHCDCSPSQSASFVCSTAHTRCSKIVSHFLGPSPCSSASHQQCLMTSAIKCPFFPYLFNLTLKNFRHANSYSYVLLQDSQLPCATVPPRTWACSWLSDLSQSLLLHQAVLPLLMVSFSLGGNLGCIYSC